MTITYDDIVQARKVALEDGKEVSHVELTEDGIDDITGDIPAVDDGEKIAKAGSVGTVASFEVYEEDENVLVTEDGTEVSIPPAEPFDIESHLSDRAVEYAEAHIGEDIQMGAVVVPPVPRDKVKEVVQEYDGASDDTFDNPVAGHLYDLTDLSLAINHSGDPMLDHSVEDDEDKYNVTRETLAEIKVARGALFSAFNRELSALADRLGIDSDQEDLVSAIRDEVGYDVDTSVDEDWPEPDDE
jgi:hypothetical protein